MMDKYGVDESVDEFEKWSTKDCPRCGAKPEVHGKTLKCPNCGTKPFEGNDAETDKARASR